MSSLLDKAQPEADPAQREASAIQPREAVGPKACDPDSRSPFSPGLFGLSRLALGNYSVDFEPSTTFGVVARTASKTVLP